MITSADFPHLTPDNHRITSPPAVEYNCVAWAAGDTMNWWQPGMCWPIPCAPDNYGLGSLSAAFASLGYEDCGLDANWVPGFEKVALYGSVLMYTHAVRQLASGKWTSKLGKGEDIEHDTPDDVAGGIYGDVMQIMKRPLPATT